MCASPPLRDHASLIVWMICGAACSTSAAAIDRSTDVVCGARLANPDVVEGSTNGITTTGELIADAVPDAFEEIDLRAVGPGAYPAARRPAANRDAVGTIS